MQHANAPLTAHGRLRMVLLVEEEGFTLQAAAAACNVAKSTCWEWVRRWRAASEPERATLSALKDRSSRPHRSPCQVPDKEAALICERRKHTGWSPGDSPKSRTSHGPIPRSIGYCAVAAARAGRDRRRLR